jgi:hypothetical protein
VSAERTARRFMRDSKETARVTDTLTVLSAKCQSAKWSGQWLVGSGCRIGQCGWNRAAEIDVPPIIVPVIDRVPSVSRWNSRCSAQLDATTTTSGIGPSRFQFHAYAPRRLFEGSAWTHPCESIGSQRRRRRRELQSACHARSRADFASKIAIVAEEVRRQPTGWRYLCCRPDDRYGGETV